MFSLLRMYKFFTSTYGLFSISCRYVVWISCVICYYPYSKRGHTFCNIQELYGLFLSRLSKRYHISFIIHFSTMEEHFIMGLTANWSISQHVFTISQYVECIATVLCLCNTSCCEVCGTYSCTIYKQIHQNVKECRFLECFYR